MNTTLSTHHDFTARQLTSSIDTQTASIVCALITVLIYVPLVIFFAYPFYKGLQCIILVKRHAELTLLAIIALLINMCVLCSTQLLFFCASSSFAATHWYKYTLLILLILTQFFSQLFANCFIMKNYLTYWDIQYSNLMRSNEWKHIIDQEYDASDSCFVKYKNSLGSKKWMKRLIAGIALFVTVMAVALALTDDVTLSLYWYGTTLTFSMAFYFISTLFIFCKLRTVKFFDDFYVYHEFRAFFKVLLIAFAVYVVLSGIASIAGALFADIQGMVDSDDGALSAFFTGYHCYIVFHIAIIYVMTRYVLLKLQNDKALQQQYDSSVPRLVVCTCCTCSNDENNGQEEEDDNDNGMETGYHLASPRDTEHRNKEIALFDILSKSDHLNAFFTHLSLELSHEILLALIEFLQFREQTRTQRHGNGIGDQLQRTETVDMLSTIEFAADTPKSSIVNNGAMNDREKAQKLFEKYIQVDAEFEININSRLRQKLSQTFESSPGIMRTLSSVHRRFDAAEASPNKIDQLPFVFDSCCDEMLKLLRYSFSRWKAKPQYIKLRDLHP